MSTTSGSPSAISRRTIPSPDSRRWSRRSATRKEADRRRPSRGRRRTMKIATYNVNGVNGRLPVLLRWLEQSVPDIACLQEIKTPDDGFPLAAIEQAGYGALWHGQKAYNGVAILARGA